MSNNIKVGSDFSGIGAFNQALKRLNIEYEEVFACDMDKYARQTFIENYGEPKYFPENVYDREIPKEPIDIYMTSPPCQSFSLAGKRKGETDDRGVLFFNSHEFIQKNNPRYFIFENVKGLLSDNNGNTFAKWVQYLGGKSVNGVPTIFPHDEAVPYHLYFKVLNAKNYGIPQNRERVFIIGIRYDVDNNFTWPKELFLEKRLRDVLEINVYEKYFLSDKITKGFLNKNESFNGRFSIKNENEIGNCITASCYNTSATDNFIKVKSATKEGYEIAEINEDSINIADVNSNTIRGKVGKKIAETIKTHPSQGIAISNNVIVSFNLPGKHEQNSRVYGINGISPTLTTMQGGGQEPKIEIDYRIRKLTPRECFRLMDFPDSFKWSVSDTQAYKQAGNSIPVGFLERIIKKLIKL